MARVEVEFYGESPDRSPVLVWLHKLSKAHYTICLDLIEVLREEGHLLRAPTSKPLKHGLFELRGRDRQGIPVRLIYAFASQRRVVLLAGCLKSSPREFERALEQAELRYRRYRQDPLAHTYREGRR